MIMTAGSWFLLAMALTQAPTKEKVESIEAKAAAELVAKGTATVVDVREQDEVEDGMAKPAQWFPMSKMEDPKALSEFLSKVPKKNKIIFYCAAGGRAGRVAQKAQALGYAVANMGGYESWVKAGLPTRKP
jgi:rhodanese-related sulfurtransferase